MGVPHTEIGRLTVNTRHVAFSHIPDNNSAVDLFPLAGPDDFITTTPLRPEPLPALIFAVDSTVGKLAGLLRMAGIDTFYRNPLSVSELVAVATTQKRILLSRNRDLLQRKEATFGYLVKTLLPKEQFQEIITFFDLKQTIQPFSRCMACNGLLQKIDKEQIDDRLEPLTRIHYHTFQQCLHCARIYWSGSHREKMEQFLNQCFPDHKWLREKLRPETKVPGLKGER